MKTRIEAAEIIIYLKFNIWFCYWNALKRHLQYTFKYNPYDPPERWIWRKTLRMVMAMWRVYTVYEPEIKPWLDEYSDKKEIYIFKRRKDLDIFIDEFINLNKK